MTRQRGAFRVGNKLMIVAVLALAGGLLGPGPASVQAVVPQPTLIWQDVAIDIGGDNALATGVAALGSKIYVAISFEDAGHQWWGQLRAYDAKKGYSWSSDLFYLKGGRTTGMAVSGSTVFVAGYYGVAGSGEEEVFLRSYDAKGKGLKVDSYTGAPMAGLYPNGVKALGSKVVAFSNYESAPGVVWGSIAGFSAKTGAYLWEADYGESWQNLISSQVNDITVSGSSVAVVGYQQTADGYKWFNVSLFSAVNGSFGSAWGARGNGVGNEALAVSWTGSIIGAAGYVTDGSGNRYARAVRIIAKGKGAGMTILEDFDLGYGENRFTTVAVDKSQVYAGGQGIGDGGRQMSFIRAYDAKTTDFLWGDTFDLAGLGGSVTTGLAAAKAGVYMAGYSLSAPGVTDWFTMAYNLGGGVKWRQDLNPFNQDTNKALGVAAASSAIVAVGQYKNNDGKLKGAVQAYAP